MAISTSDPPVVRRHLVALPRGRPVRPTTGHHLIAIPRGRPAVTRVTVPIPVGERPPSDGSRSALAVAVSIALLVLLCCGAAVTVLRLAG